MATDEQIEKEIQTFIKKFTDESSSTELDETIEKIISTYEEKNKKVLTVFQESNEFHNKKELKDFLRANLEYTIQLCEKYKTKDINLYQRYRELTRKIIDNDKYYAEDLTLFQKEAEEFKELMHIVNKTRMILNTISIAFDDH